MYRKVAHILRSAGIEHVVAPGGRHWHIHFEINGVPYREVLHLGTVHRTSSERKVLSRFEKLARMQKAGVTWPTPRLTGARGGTAA